MHILLKYIWFLLIRGIVIEDGQHELKVDHPEFEHQIESVSEIEMNQLSFGESLLRILTTSRPLPKRWGIYKTQIYHCSCLAAAWTGTPPCFGYENFGQYSYFCRYYHHCYNNLGRPLLSPCNYNSIRLYCFCLQHNRAYENHIYNNLPVLHKMVYEDNE